MSDLLKMSVAELAKPDYHKLNKNGEREIHALLCAFAKHHVDSPDIGWEQTTEILRDAICEKIGDKEFCEWLIRIAGDKVF